MAANDSSVKGFIDEAFDRILDILAQLGVYKKSPKFFIIYAHDNEKFLEYEAHSALVKRFIEWFKKLRLDVDSDRSPHGLVPGRGVEIEGASVDIIKNQVCLLPQQLQERSVSYVLIFGSKLLEKYMEDEATQMLVDGKSYIMALVDACRACVRGQPRKPSDSIGTDIIENVVKELYRIQLRYSKMTDYFHHVLTEMALVDFREEFGSSSYTLPIRLGKLRDDDASFPKSIASKKTRLRVSVDLDSAYTSLFKILLEFEDFEDDRPLLEALRNAFVECVKLFSDGNRRSPDHSRNEREAIILGALRRLTDSEQYRKRERKITTPFIRQILNKQSLLGLSSVRRLSGEELSVELIDIELVARNSAQKNGPKVDGQQQLVTIDKLFEKRKLADSRETWPKRIHIQGPPGIGKSTLSRRIVYEYDWNPRLRGKFDLVILLPLRRLKHSNNMEQLLFNEYFQLEPRGRQLAAALYELILKSESLPDDDAKALLAQGNNVLFILDGLDETQGWPEKSRKLLSMLIRCRNVVITSRSTANDSVNSVPPVDLEIEARGLSIKSVWKYLRDEKFVSAEHAEKIGRFIESNEGVLGMIQTPIHLDILCYGWNDLAILESYVAFDRDETKASEDLGNNGETDKLPTITKLYKAIVQRLWRNDIVRLKKYDKGELLTHDIVNAVRDPGRLTRVIQYEQDFLGKLAFTLICKNQLVFTDKDIQCAIRKHELESRTEPLPLCLERNLQALSFIRLESGEKGLREYRFVHFTVQEFFAAQHLSQNSANWKRYLPQYKYSRRWAVIWQFLAGLISSNSNSSRDIESRDIEVFFNLWEAEPRDLAGYKHAYLIMNCLAECEWCLGRVDHPLLQRLVADVTAWMTWECRSCTEGGLSSQPRFPENILLHEIRNSHENDVEFYQNSSTWIYLLLDHRQIMSAELCHYLLDLLDPQFAAASLASDDKSRNERFTSLMHSIQYALSRTSLLPRTVFDRLFEYLRDGCFNEDAKKFVRFILSCYHMPEWAHLKLIEMMGSLHLSGFKHAESIIKSQRKYADLSPDVYRLLMKLFTQSRERGTLLWVKSLLQSQPRLPPDVVSDLCDRLPDSHQASWLLGWCSSDVIEILVSQTELGSETIEKLRDQLKTTNGRRGIILALSLVRYPALQSDVRPRLLAAFESIYETTETTSNEKTQLQQIARALLSITPIRSEIFTKLLSHNKKTIQRFALLELQDPTDLDDVGRHLFRRLLKEMPYDVCLNCAFFRDHIRSYVEKPITWLTTLLSSRLSDPKASDKKKFDPKAYDEEDIYSYLHMLLKSSYHDLHQTECKEQSQESLLKAIVSHQKECKEQSQVLEESLLKAIVSHQKECKEQSQVLKENLSKTIVCQKKGSQRLGRLLQQISRLQPKTIGQLLNLLKDGNKDAFEALETRVELAPQALELLRSTTDRKLELGIKQIFEKLGMLCDHLPLTVRNHFCDILENHAKKYPEVALQAIGELLLGENALPLNTIRACNRISDKPDWSTLSLTDFCQNVNSFDAEDIQGLFAQIFIQWADYTLRKDANDCLWIQGGFLYHESGNGIVSYPLNDEPQFRRALRKAQRHWEVPKWQWIGVDFDEDESEVSSNHNLSEAPALADMAVMNLTDDTAENLMENGSQTSSDLDESLYR